jgi:multicomponent Na+:H+ antiporter subunit E
VSFFTLNLLLAAVWILLTGDLSLGGAIAGLVLGFLAIALGRRALGGEVYVESLVATGQLIGRFVLALVRANLQLARDVLRREPRFSPAFVSIDLRDLGQTRLVIVGLLVSLTPGTITVGTDRRARVLHVHTVYAHDRDAVVSEVRDLARLVRAATFGGRAGKGRA